MERRAMRREEWAGSAREKASGRFEAARHALDGIEPGQPVLVGHHSERRHRRAIARHDSNLRASFEREGMAAHHEQAAATIRASLDVSIFSDDPDAVEALEARIREREAEAARIKALNAAIRREQRKGLEPGWLDRIGATEEERQSISRNVSLGWRHEPAFPSHVLANLRGRIEADRKRLQAIKAQQERRCEAEASPGGVSIKRFPQHNWCVLTFAEKPGREVLAALRAAGFGWGGGYWQGRLDKLPAAVAALVEAGR